MTTAIDRAGEMMFIPIRELPELARQFATKMGKEIGMCGEVMVTAFAIYAQCVEGLPCNDISYLAKPDDIEWFKEKMSKQNIRNYKDGKI